MAFLLTSQYTSPLLVNHALVLLLPQPVIQLLVQLDVPPEVPPEVQLDVLQPLSVLLVCNNQILALPASLAVIPDALDLL